MKYQALNNIVTFTKGKKALNIYESSQSDRIPYLLIESFNKNSLKFTEAKDMIICNPDDILIVWDGARAGLSTFGHSGAIGSTIVKLSIKNINEITPKYLFYIINAEYKKLNRNTHGAAIPHLNRYYLESLKIPILPIDIQRRIAEILDKADGARQKRQESLKLTDQFLKSTFLELFGDPVRNEKGWEYKKLPLLISKCKNSLKRGPFGGALKKEIFVDNGYLVYEQNHALNNDYSFKRYFIDEKTFNILRAFEVKRGDILISCSGVYLGKLSIVPQGAPPGIINQALLKVTLNTEIMLQIFFIYVFSHPAFKAKYISSNRGSGIPNLPPMSMMKEINFITPPIKLQKRFAEIVEKTEVLKEKQRTSAQELGNLFNSLMQRAFRGEIT